MRSGKWFFLLHDSRREGLPIIFLGSSCLTPNWVFFPVLFLHCWHFFLKWNGLFWREDVIFTIISALFCVVRMLAKGWLLRLRLNICSKDQRNIPIITSVADNMQILALDLCVKVIQRSRLICCCECTICYTVRPRVATRSLFQGIVPYLLLRCW